MQLSFKILIGLCFIWYVCSCVGPLWQFMLVLRHFFSCSCIVHSWNSLLHARCLTECLSDILVLNWTQLSSNAWFLSWLIMFIMFWLVFVCFTHYFHFMPQCHAMHTLGTPHASHAASPCITCCTHMHQHGHKHAQWFTSCILFFFTWLNTYSILFCVCFELFSLCF